MSDVFQKLNHGLILEIHLEKRARNLSIKTTIHKNAGVNLGKLLDHQLIKMIRLGIL